MIKKKPITDEIIKTAEQKLEQKKAELLQAEKELAELKTQQETEQNTYNAKGIVLTPEDLARKEAIKLGQEEAAVYAARPKPVKPQYIPNPYLAFREKVELADMMRWGNTDIKTKSFIDPRHQVIYNVYTDDFNYKHKAHSRPEDLIEALRRCGKLELAGGVDFITDIFQGLHE